MISVCGHHIKLKIRCRFANKHCSVLNLISIPPGGFCSIFGHLCPNFGCPFALFSIHNLNMIRLPISQEHDLLRNNKQRSQHSRFVTPA